MTDYDFPDAWGLLSPEQKAAWFLRERVFRQARQQDTHFGRRYQRYQERRERFRHDG